MNNTLSTSAPEVTQQNPTISPLALAGVTIAGAAVLAATAKPARAVSPAVTYAQIPGSGDVKVLNYALALEALEADLYAQAILRLTTGGTNGLGQTITGLGLPSSNIAVQYITEFAVVESDHRNFLSNALGASAITQTIFKGVNFDFGFENASTASLNYVVQTVLSAEALGVRAYLGAIPSFADYTYLQIAAAILGTEARHTAAITIVQNILTNASNPPAPLYNNNNGRDSPLDQNSVLNTVSPYIVFPTAM